MKREKLVIWGASGHAIVAADIVRLGEQYEIAGYLDDMDAERRGQPFCGSLVRGGREQLSSLRSEGVSSAFVAVGDCEARMSLAEIAHKQGFRLATLIHPRSVVAADVEIGEGSMVAAGAVICPGARLGQNVIVNTSASVDHECVIGDGAHISPGVHLAGCVRVGECTWIGLGANLKENVRIGSHTVVGAGSLVLSDLPAGVLAYGVPAKVISPQSSQLSQHS